MAQITQLKPYALPGGLYGSFAGKVTAVGLIKAHFKGMFKAIYRRIEESSWHGN